MTNVVPAIQNSKALPAGQIRIVARIQSQRRVGGGAQATFLTVCIMPAADSFSHPSTIELRSRRPLGAPGSDVDLICTLTGYSRKYNVTDETTGYKTPVNSAQNVLDVIE